MMHTTEHLQLIKPSILEVVKRPLNFEQTEDL
jgi:hypothetical protein